MISLLIKFIKNLVNTESYDDFIFLDTEDEYVYTDRD